MQTPTYRETLKRHLAERIASNPRYSLRAFSRDLAISPSRLSEILNGKQGLSEEWATKIASRLQLSESETEEFRSRVLASDGRAKRTRRAALERLGARGDLPTLEHDTFKVISDWYHFSLLELTCVKGFQPRPPWIARRLGISEYEAKLALERLTRLGLLERKAGGGLRRTHRSVTTTNDVPSEAIRRFNRQLLEKAGDAITRQSVEERDISSLTLAVRHKDIPLVKERIRQFRRALNDELEARVPEGKADEVYGFTMQFFRLTNPEQP